MCTAVTLTTKDHYFGRNLDLSYSYGEQLVVTPRNYSFSFGTEGKMGSHYAILGVAYVVDDTPLYYDGVNEKGLAMAGLNFPGNAVYGGPQERKINLASFELIPWILGKCDTVAQAREYLGKIQVVNRKFREDMPSSPLHWILADSRETITIEAVAEGLKVYDNPAGVLTNNPPFPQQLFSLSQYMHLSPKQPENLFGKGLGLLPYSVGMGTIGMPGDWSSTGRFVRASFLRANSKVEPGETESVNQFFHILGNVAYPRGCALTKEGDYEVTIYSSCCNMDLGIYYVTTYNNSQVRAVDMHRENLDGRKLVCFSLYRQGQVVWEN